MDATDSLVRAHRDYGRRCDIVSCFEVFFTEARQMADTVAHFERFPRLIGEDDNPITPDFTVSFVDGTLVVGEIARLARPPESLESLLSQVQRYARLTSGPSSPASGGGHEVSPVTAVDVLLLVPSGEVNAACDRIQSSWVSQDAERGIVSSPSVERPSILGYSYDDEGDRMIFTYDDRASNPRLRSHGRRPSLETWLHQNSDTLRCRSERFSRVTTVKRFMNDRPPAVYTATLLWLEVLPALADGALPKDVSVNPADVAAWLRQHFGWGDANAVRRALEFLARAGLARQRQDDWLVALKPIANSTEEVRRELIDRHLARPTGPVSDADRRELTESKRRSREDAEANLERQDQMQLEPPDETLS